MKLIFASDIHGDLESMESVKEIFETERADKLIFSGDLLYHGPRNDLPKSYNPKEVIKILNSLSNNIISVRGNCDTEVDQMVLDFPILADFSVIFDGNLRIYVTHGHIYNIENPLKLQKGDVMVCGHTHVPGIWEKDGFLFLNPGSVSLPKENNSKTYMIYEDKTFSIKDFDGNIFKSITVYN